MSDPRTSLSGLIAISETRVKPYKGFIFLCGGQINVRSTEPCSVRDVIYSGLIKDSALEKRVQLAEHFKDWAYGGVYSDLVTFERHLAELSAVIVLVLESPGSLAELGLFSILEPLRDKLAVFIAASYYKDTSFIRLGPIGYLEHLKNIAEVHDWLTPDHQFDVDQAKELQDELVEAVKKRLVHASPERSFDNKIWLHKALLICELIGLMSALTVTEIQEFGLAFGVDRSQQDVKQTLFLLERVELIRIVERGTQRFYVCTDDIDFLHLKTKSSKPFDKDRFRAEVMRFYASSDKPRFNALRKARTLT